MGIVGDSASKVIFWSMTKEDSDFENIVVLSAVGTAYKGHPQGPAIARYAQYDTAHGNNCEVALRFSLYQSDFVQLRIVFLFCVFILLPNLAVDSEQHHHRDVANSTGIGSLDGLGVCL